MPAIAKIGASERIPCLDGLRACAIALVIIQHGRTQIPVALPEVAERIVKHWGVLGVELFFGLSGYLITYLLCSEFAENGKISLKSFYARRALRILPPVLAYLGFVIALNLAGIIKASWYVIASALCFFNNYTLSAVPADVRYLGHMWSLSMEEQFYLLWPFALAFLGPKRCRKAVLAVALAVPLFRVGDYFLFPLHRNVLTRFFHTSFDRFLWGSLLALYRDSPVITTLLKPFRSIAALAGLVLFYLVGGPFLDEYAGGFYSLPFGMTLQGISVAIMIAWLGARADSAPAKFLNLGVVRNIGLISYSIYLWQNVFMGKSNGPAWMNNFLVAAALALAVGCVSYWLTEKPFVGLRKRFHPAASEAKSAPGPSRPEGRGLYASSVNALSGKPEAKPAL